MADFFVVDVEDLPPHEGQVHTMNVSRQAERDLSWTREQAGTNVDYDVANAPVPEPILLKGVGGSTLFGISNYFKDEYPTTLTGKVAPEEFLGTMEQLNGILQKSVPFNLKLLLCGCLCCCCTLGLSLGPVVYMNKRMKSKIEKLLEAENSRLYHKVGLCWKLHREETDNSNLRSYVISIEYLPRTPLSRPD